MRVLIAALSLFLLVPLALGQASGSPDHEAEVKEGLRKLFSELNEAIIKHDRAALERIYADEFQFIRSTGGVVDKTSQINGIMTNTPASSSPVPVPSFDQLRVYGDVAVLRGSSRGVAGTDIYVKRGGRWQIVQVQGTRLPPERKPIQLDPKVLDSFIGKYEFAPGAFATVTKEVEALVWKPEGRPKLTLVPLSDTRFYAKENDAEMTFSKGDKGQITGVVLRLGSCQESKAKKIE